jgi:hypothetical protein
MIDYEARLDAIRQGATFQRPEVEAIGMVLVEVLRPLTLEPLSWHMIDALRAIDAASRRAGPSQERQGIAPGAEFSCRS